MLDDRFTKAIAAVVALTLVVSAAAAGGAVSLQDGGDATQSTTETQTQDTSYLRVAHFSPDSPSVNVTVGNKTVVSDAAYGNVTEYMNFSAGTQNVTVTVAGQPGEVLYEGNVTLEPRTVTTLAASGEFTSMSQTEFNATMLHDDPWKPSDDQSAIRVAHLSPDAGNVDVVVTEGPEQEAEETVTEGETETETEAEDDTETETEAETETETEADTETETETDAIGDETETETDAIGEETETETDDDAFAQNPQDAQQENQTVIADNVSFRNASSYMNVPAGEYTLEIREETENNDGTVVATVNVTVEGGQAYTVFAGGYANPDDAPAGEEFGVTTVQDASMTLNLPDATANETEAADTETETDGIAEETETETDAVGDETETETDAIGEETETETDDVAEETETETDAVGDETETETEADEETDTETAAE